MSYLKSLTETFPRPTRKSKADEGWAHIMSTRRLFRVVWRSTSGTIIVVPPKTVPGQSPATSWHVYYKRHSALGKRLGSNAEFERVYIGRELQRMGVVPVAASIDWNSI